MVSLATARAKKKKYQRTAGAGSRTTALVLLVATAIAVGAARRRAAWTASVTTPPLTSADIAPHAPSSWTPRTSARICRDDKNIPKLDASMFQSQQGEDVLLLKWFGKLCEGTYIEMGALDGLRFSNSYVFNKGLNWTGVLIEASPQNFQEMAANRPKEIARVHAAVCQESQTVHWVTSDSVAVNGIFEFAAPSFRKKWWGDNDKALLAESTPVHCSPLQDLLAQHVVVGYDQHYYFDFFSLNVEGAEFQVLKSIDFSRTGFGIIFLEADKHDILKNDVARMFLEEKGYRCQGKAGGSYWFLHPAFHDIYQEFI